MIGALVSALKSNLMESVIVAAYPLFVFTVEFQIFLKK